MSNKAEHSGDEESNRMKGFLGSEEDGGFSGFRRNNDGNDEILYDDYVPNCDKYRQSSKDEMYAIQMEEFVKSVLHVKEEPFHNTIMYTLVSPALFKHPVKQYRWQTSEDSLSYFFNYVPNSDYILLEKWFNEMWNEIGLPCNNALAFWKSFLEQYTTLVNENHDSLQKLIFAATCGYGDFFFYSYKRHAPRDFIWPWDVEDEPQDVKDDVQAQTNELLKSLPERTASLNGFSDFKQSWNQHYKSAKLYENWLNRYRQLTVIEPDNYSEVHQELHSLAYVFRQYTTLMEGYSNSKYDDFNSHWEDFLQGKENCLFYSLQVIAHMLRNYDELAEIAPIYVLLQFQKNRRKLYTSSSDNLIKGKLPLQYCMPPSSEFCEEKRSGRGKFTLFSQSQTNIRGPYFATVVTYQILRFLFLRQPNLTRKKYDVNLCDYMMQFVCPLIGQSYYQIPEEQAVNVYEGKSFLSHNSISSATTNRWIHSLLQKISERYLSATNIRFEDIPRIVDGIGVDVPSKKMTEEVRSVIDDNFYDEYFRIFLYSSYGIGYYKKPLKAMDELAHLFDRTFRKLALFSDSGDRKNWDESLLMAVERIFHETCIEKISLKSKRPVLYSELLIFLQSYLMSEKFYQSGQIFKTVYNKLIVK